MSKNTTKKNKTNAVTRRLRPNTKQSKLYHYFKEHVKPGLVVDLDELERRQGLGLSRTEACAAANKLVERGLLFRFGRGSYGWYSPKLKGITTVSTYLNKDECDLLEKACRLENDKMAKAGATSVETVQEFIKKRALEVAGAIVSSHKEEEKPEVDVWEQSGPWIEDPQPTADMEMPLFNF